MAGTTPTGPRSGSRDDDDRRRENAEGVRRASGTDRHQSTDRTSQSNTPAWYTRALNTMEHLEVTATGRLAADVRWVPGTLYYSELPPQAQKALAQAALSGRRHRSASGGGTIKTMNVDSDEEGDDGGHDPGTERHVKVPKAQKASEGRAARGSASSLGSGRRSLEVAFAPRRASGSAPDVPHSRFRSAPLGSPLGGEGAPAARATKTVRVAPPPPSLDSKVLSPHPRSRTAQQGATEGKGAAEGGAKGGADRRVRVPPMGSLRSALPDVHGVARRHRTASGGGSLQGRDQELDRGAPRQRDPVADDTTRQRDPVADDTIRQRDPVADDTIRQRDPVADDTIRQPDPAATTTLQEDPAATTTLQQDPADATKQRHHPPYGSLASLEY